MQLTFRILRELSTERTGFNSQVFFVTLPATFLSACCGSYNISATGFRVAWDHYTRKKEQLKTLTQEDTERVRDFKIRIDDYYKIAYGENAATSVNATVI